MRRGGHMRENTQPTLLHTVHPLTGRAHRVSVVFRRVSQLHSQGVTKNSSRLHISDAAAVLMCLPTLRINGSTYSAVVLLDPPQVHAGHVASCVKRRRRHRASLTFGRVRSTDPAKGRPGKRRRAAERGRAAERAARRQPQTTDEGVDAVKDAIYLGCVERHRIGNSGRRPRAAPQPPIWALSSSAARPECVAQPGVLLETPPEMARVTRCGASKTPPSTCG